MKPRNLTLLSLSKYLLDELLNIGSTDELFKGSKYLSLHL